MAPTLVLTARKLAKVMPRGLPSSKPRKTPMLTLPSSGENWVMLKYSRLGMVTPALARAKMGMMQKFTHGFRLCSRR